MPKPQLKSNKPAPKAPKSSATPAPTPAPPAPVAKKLGKGLVLVTKTPNELATLIGGDTPVQVSRKSLIVAATAADQASTRARLGI